MKDVEDSRQAPKSWREYLDDSLVTFRLYRWVYKTLKTNEGNKWFKKMMLALFVSSFFQLGQPFLVSKIFDGLLERNINMILLALFAVGVFTYIQRISKYKQDVAREKVWGINNKQIDDVITARYFEKSGMQHIQENSNLHVNNIEKGRSSINEASNMMLFDGCPLLFQLTISLGFLWFFSPVAGMIVTASLILYVLCSFYMNAKAAERGIPHDRQWRALNRYRGERWEKIERVKTTGKEAEEYRLMSLRHFNVIKEDFSIWARYILQGAYRGVISAMANIAIVIYGIWMVWENNWTVALLYPLLAWSERVSNNIWMVGHIEHRLNWSMPSILSLKEALTLEPTVVTKPNATKLSGDQQISLEFRDVSFRYKGQQIEADKRDEKIPVIQDFSLKVQAGQVVGLIGKSGSGKTTLMRAALRYDDPDEGQVLVGGVDYRDLDLQSVMEHVGYVPQGPSIFDGTVRSNLTYGLSTEQKERIDDEELWRIAREYEADLGERLTDGLDTKVGRSGIKLSGGQAQRLSFASAMIKEPRLLIIDEATSNLDSTTEKSVQRSLAKALEGGVSAMIIAHRLSTVRNLCDRFVVIRPIEEISNGDSQIEAQAETFEELYEISPTFRQLADDQDLIIS